MSFILIDRRKASRGKSSPNRQKLMKRIKHFIKQSTPQNIGKVGGVQGTNSNTSSPVKVAGAALEQPFFTYARDGDRELVFVGNDEYNRGDKIFIPEEMQGGSKGGPGEQGEDDFVVNVARDEFLEAYFEDCELPNLVNENYTERLDNKFKTAGFSTSGSPAQLSVIRTYKQMLGRTAALIDPLNDEIEKLQKQLEGFKADLEKETDEEAKSALRAVITQLEKQIKELEDEVDFYDNFDKTDLRYRKREAMPLKTVDAVIFFLMDISASMDAEKKTIARRWFALLYAFIKRRYPITELVFIAHTDEAYEMSENDFFSTRINGGTCVSPALNMVNKIIRTRYDFKQINIYVCHASDGDNFEYDNPAVVEEMVGDGHLMQKIQFFSYAEVGKPYSGWFSMSPSSGDSDRADSSLWQTYESVRDSSPFAAQKLIQVIIETPDECYPIFKKVFKKRGK